MVEPFGVYAVDREFEPREVREKNTSSLSFITFCTCMSARTMAFDIPAMGRWL